MDLKLARWLAISKLLDKGFGIEPTQQKSSSHLAHCRQHIKHAFLLQINTEVHSIRTCDMHVKPFVFKHPLYELLPKAILKARVSLYNIGLTALKLKLTVAHV